MQYMFEVLYVSEVLANLNKKKFQFYMLKFCLTSFSSRFNHTQLFLKVDSSFVFYTSHYKSSSTRLVVQVLASEFAAKSIEVLDCIKITVVQIELDSSPI